MLKQLQTKLIGLRLETENKIQKKQNRKIRRKFMKLANILLMNKIQSNNEKQ